jgi:dTDP-4-dehydrorhamnose 3,5-epimerase
VIFTETSVPGAFVIDVEPFEDERGLFARSFDREEFAEHGLSPEIAQCSTSWNRSRGTLRGLHYQAAPHGENKLVRCTRGSLWAVMVDLRPESPAYCRWASAPIDAENRRMYYAPKGIASGFITLADSTELLYAMSHPFTPSHYAGVRWNDPAFGIEWPEKPRVISDRDASFADFEP